MSYGRAWSVGIGGRGKPLELSGAVFHLEPVAHEGPSKLGFTVHTITVHILQGRATIRPQN